MQQSASLTFSFPHRVEKTPTMDLMSKPIQNPSVHERQIVEGEMILMNGDTAVSLALTNETALIAWKLVDGKRSIKDIIKAVEAHFQYIPDTVTGDVINLLELLSEDGFIGFELKTGPELA